MTPANRESLPLVLGGTGLVAADGETAMAVVEAAWCCGVRMFDSAPFYGHGLCETRLGAAIAPHPGARVIIKVGIRLQKAPRAGTSALRDLWPANGPFQAAPGYCSDDIVAGFGESCDRLGTDTADIALLHGLSVFPGDYTAHRASAIRGMQALRASGRARRIGVAVNSLPAAFSALEDWAPDVLLLANALSLTAQDRAAPLLDLCQAREITLLAAAPFGGGSLFRDRALAEICAQTGVDPVAAALHYPLRAPCVEAVVPASSNPARIAAFCAALAKPLPPELWERIDGAGLGPLC